MRKLFLLFIVFALDANAQDVIVKSDGSTILSKVLEVNKEDVKYKKHTNLNGPTYTIAKSEILSINYENGDKDMFSEKSASDPSSDSRSQVFEEKAPNVRNREIINKYNVNYSLVKQNKIGKSNCNKFLGIIGVSDSSVLSNDDVEVTIERMYAKPYYYCHCNYKIVISNKSAHTIYIDLGNTFRINDDGTYEPYFKNEQKATTKGNGGGIGVNLGAIAGSFGIGGMVGTLASGVSVGRGSSSSISTTYFQQRVIAVPKHSKKILSECQRVGNGDGEEISQAEDFSHINLSNEKRINIRKNEVVLFNETTSPWHRQYIITYSNSESFNKYHTMNIELYLRQVIGGIYVAYEYHQLDRTWKKYQKYIDDINDYTILSSMEQ